MGKLVLWLALAGLVWLGWTLWRVSRRRAEADSRRPPNTDAPSADAPSRGTGLGAETRPEPMVRCGHCNVYLPAGDSVAGEDGRAYCSTAHRDTAGRRPERADRS